MFLITLYYSGLNPASAADGKLSSNSNEGQDPNSELTSEQGVKDSDIDAAKIAAMKAAELGIFLLLFSFSLWAVGVVVD